MIKKGDKLRVLDDSRGMVRHFRLGEVVTALTDEEPGIFASLPYVTVQTDGGKVCSGHAKRFEKLPE